MPHWLPEGFRPPRQCCLSASLLPPACPAPTGKLCDASLRRSDGAFSKWSNDPALTAPAQNPETTARPANRLSAMRYPVRNLCPRNTRPEVRENKLRAADPDGPPSRKTIRMPIRRTRRIRACSTTGSDAQRRGGRREWQGEPLRSRSAPASHLALACPVTYFHRKVIP